MRLIQHDDLFIRHFQTREWPFELHNHNHFELIFIHHGSGTHQLNGETFRYEGPCYYALAPEDEHIFYIEEETKYTVLKFTNVYLGQQLQPAAIAQWEQRFQQLIVATRSHGVPVMAKEVLVRISSVMEVIAAEWQLQPVPSNEGVLHLIRGVLALLAGLPAEAEQGPQRSVALTQAMHYIHTHITNPAQLQQEMMAPALQMGKARLQVLFKQELGVSVRDYINEYKSRQIENKLRYSDMSIKEIAGQYGFGDLSHLNKFFRKMKGTNPRSYRTQLKSGKGA
ncbi:helix-turn-helix domain-containing protein [Chitinophaga oryzae]|uniref:Helix-turn-helix domain-containing protein n=1 Tax=Chitinophaga oryzae TaxID=2725414 RepID=A0AAE7D5I4_9BACT|nr:AraC family transcriptional regulator [Chitinophaga oryzae]QJB30104.1 helix-turn-helix domain-containing protein [Chitinophaga oryzae]QJB36601.1 helix-turn-helix domain-containing protein [Chitinophaga oryzae]